MNDIKKSAEKLATQNAWVRKGIEKMMKEWGEISDCAESVRSNASVHIHDYPESGVDEEYYLVSGQREIKMIDEWGYEKDLSNSVCFWNVLSIEDLRNFLQKFSIAVKEIQNKIEEKLQTDYSILKKFQ